MSKDYFGPLEEDNVEEYKAIVPISYMDYEGQRFGKWLVLKREGRYRWSCQCDCGRTGSRSILALISGKSTQCRWCARLPGRISFFRSHGQ